MHRPGAPLVVGVVAAAAILFGPTCDDRAIDRAWSRAVGVASPSTDRAVECLRAVLERATADGTALGTQLALGDVQGVRVECATGHLSHRRRHLTTPETRFSIGSVSKPIAAALVMRLAERGSVDLDLPVDTWLPELADLHQPDDSPAGRAPTLRELLCHRGGLLSQTRRLTPRQLGLLYDWTRPLEVAVRRIALEPLLHAPGAAFAYSSAGYDVAGRVAEVAAGDPFDRLLARQITGPLGMDATGYRVFGDPPGHATAGFHRDGDVRDHPMAPNRAPSGARRILVGGGLSSTARDLARFARMVAAGGSTEGATVLDRETWVEWVSAPPFDQRYGLGWRLLDLGTDGCAARVAHEGAIAGSRAFLRVDLESGRFAVVLVTLSRPAPGAGPSTLEGEIDRAIGRFLDVPVGN